MLERLMPRDAVARSYERITLDGEPGIFIELVDREWALKAAEQTESALEAGASLPLAGRTVVVKGNIDVAGYRTTAGCPSYGEIASHSAPAVRALEAAGAVVVGITNLDQFATGLVGTRSPYGICPNAHWPGLVSGGSSSGSAVAVARGLVDLGVGTDTAGSGRVPAAANGIVGLKPTPGWVSTAGVVPACKSLDCVSIFATSVDEADTAIRVMAGKSESIKPLGAPLRIGGIDGEFDLEPFVAAGKLMYGGAFVAERYEAVGAFIEAHLDAVDPVVTRIILGAKSVPAGQLARDQAELARLRGLTKQTWSEFDLIAVPTVRRLPTVAEVLADPIGPNSELGTYTAFVNLLDLCALTVPVGAAKPDGPPESITLIGPAWTDAWLVTAAARLQTDTPAILRSS